VPACDGQTHNDGIYRASIVSCGKNKGAYFLKHNVVVAVAVVAVYVPKAVFVVLCRTQQFLLQVIL